MALFMIFLAVYAAVCIGFFVGLVRWTVSSTRGCACGGSLRGGVVAVIHSPKSCYPAAESLHAT